MHKHLALVALLVPALGLPVAADDGGIAWYGTWSQAQKVAQKTGRPILLLSAAPHCHNVPGVW